jgi:sarcosine oxidase
VIYDVVVVGAGVMGAATARSVARRGRRTLLLERFALGHKRGSSHGRSRIFRLSYPDPMYVRMAQEALPLWRALEGDAGVDLLTTTGGLDCGPGIDANAGALAACGAECEMLDGEEAARRWPGLAFPAPEPVLYHPDGGYVRADDAVAACARTAAAAGAEMREGAPVTAVEAAGDRARVVVGGETIEAPVAVVTAGAWARGLLAGAGIDIPTRPTRETVSYFRIEDGSLPTVVEWARPALYALPSPGQGLKVGEHVAGPEIDPDADGPPSRDSIEATSAWIARRFPSAEPVAHLSETCLYTNTPDEHFILERHGPVVVGSPCSGHGFKFAPLIGERLADLACA